MSTLQRLMAREVLDALGEPTLEVEAWAEGGGRGRSTVASGGTVGPHEAQELRDNEPKRHRGRGVRKAIALISSEIHQALRPIDVDDQSAVDDALVRLDGTDTRCRLGANTTLAVSIAVARAAADERRDELHVHLNRIWNALNCAATLGGRGGGAIPPRLPMPMAHMISGRSRDGRTLDFQDVLMVPVGARDLSEAVDMIGDVYRELGDALHRHGHPAHLVGHQGAYGNRFRSDAQAIDLLLDAVLAAGLAIARDVALAIDVAASHILDRGCGLYTMNANRAEHDPDGMVDMLEHWTRQYPIVSIEDGLDHDDWDAWAHLTRRIGPTVQVAGDDLFATQAGRIERGGGRKAGNAVVIKPGQAGTLTETLAAILEARKQGNGVIVSARSGETDDTAIADLAVATSADQIKVGGVARSERVAKYNRLLRIESDLGDRPLFAGWSTRPLAGAYQTEGLIDPPPPEPI